MAYETGTATDHQDLWNKLITFLTENEDLVYAGQNWTVAWTLDSDIENGVVVQGPGLGGTDEVLVGMSMLESPTDDAAEIRLRGMTGINPSALGYNDHVNTTPNYVRLLMRTQPMDYWFVSNGRRFVVMVRVSTVYEHAYAGLFLPYSQPSQYPYPLFIGGSAQGGGSPVVYNWRNVGDGHANYTRGVRNTGATTSNDPPAWVLSPQGEWLRAGINSPCNVYLGPGYFGDGFGIASGVGLSNYGYNSIVDRIIPAFGNAHSLTPITLLQQTPADQTFGVLDGVYRVGGRGNAPENTISVDGVTHVVGTNTYRTDLADFMAIALEE